MVTLTELVTSFTLGVVTPLTAVCVVPLYPGFVAYVANQRDGGLSVGRVGTLVAAGVLLFMTVFGVLFTTLLEVSLTKAIGVVSPVAFGVLGVASLFLLADVEIGAALPTVEPPQSEYPALSALGYGFFFGGIVIPCNPGFIGIFLSRALLFQNPVGSLSNFYAFGFGIAAPLVGLAVVSTPWQNRVVSVLTGHQSLINRATGAVMLAVSLYYLTVVFGVIPLPV